MPNYREESFICNLLISVTISVVKLFSVMHVRHNVSAPYELKMENDELYDHIQETKTAFVISLLIAIYCFSVIMKSIAVHIEWKEICSGIGFSIVIVVDTWLFIRLVKLQKALKGWSNYRKH